MKIYLLPVLAALVFCSCRSKGNTETAEMARQEHIQESNIVEIMTLAETSFHRQMLSNGKLSARRKSVIGYPTEGVIASIPVENGQQVQAGEILAVLDTQTAVNQLNTAMINMEQARIDLADTVIGFGLERPDTSLLAEESRATVKTRSGYNMAVANLEQARLNLANCTIRAPFSGKVANLKSKPFEKTEAELCTVIDDSEMDVDFTVTESELGFVKVGQRITVIPFFEPEKRGTGTVTSINPTIDDRGQIAVKARIHNVPRGFMDGMNVKVLVENSVPGQLVVPKNAVVIRNNLEVLFRYDNGRAVWTYVHTVMENSDSYVVTANTSRGADLQAGDRIIVSGNLNLADGSPVQPAE